MGGPSTLGNCVVAACDNVASAVERASELGRLNVGP
jgi:hypothetical protein